MFEHISRTEPAAEHSRRNTHVLAATSSLTVRIGDLTAKVIEEAGAGGQISP